MSDSGASMNGPGPALTLLPSGTSPLVSFRVQFGAGAIDDPAGKEGLNAVTALTIGQGGTRDLAYREVIDRLYPMAATVAPQPDREVTTFIGQVHRDHLDAFYELFTGMLLAPRFDAADFNRARDLLVASIETTLRSNDDEDLGKEALNLILYEDHPYGRPDAGTVRGLKGITLDDVREHYRRYVRRGNVRAGIAGGYPEALVERLRSDLCGLPEGAPERRDPPAPKGIDGMRILIVEKAAPATAISMGHPLAVTQADPDYCALMIANSYLGEHRTFNGRLMNVMRGDRGLNYGDYSYIENFIQDGSSNFPLPNIPRRRQHFSIWIRPVDPGNAPFALRQAAREMRRLVETGLSNEEFEAARTFLLCYSKLWTQSLSRRLGYLIDAEFYGTGFLLDRMETELPRLSAADVNAAVRRHLDPDRLGVAMVTSDGKALSEVLLSGRPTPIRYQTPTTREDLLQEDREIESFPLRLDSSRVRVAAARDLFER